MFASAEKRGYERGLIMDINYTEVIIALITAVIGFLGVVVN